MITTCIYGCGRRFDDEYRSTICPHNTFAANDGHNGFRHYPTSFLSGSPEKQQESREGAQGDTKEQPRPDAGIDPDLLRGIE